MAIPRSRGVRLRKAGSFVSRGSFSLAGEAGLSYPPCFCLFYRSRAPAALTFSIFLSVWSPQLTLRRNILGTLHRGLAWLLDMSACGRPASWCPATDAADAPAGISGKGLIDKGSFCLKRGGVPQAAAGLWLSGAGRAACPRVPVPAAGPSRRGSRHQAAGAAGPAASSPRDPMRLRSRRRIHPRWTRFSTSAASGDGAARSYFFRLIAAARPIATSRPL